MGCVVRGLATGIAYWIEMSITAKTGGDPRNIGELSACALYHLNGLAGASGGSGECTRLACWR
jgi:hypothetical protein